MTRLTGDIYQMRDTIGIAIAEVNRGQRVHLMSLFLSALFGGVQQSLNLNITAANNARAISVKEAPTLKHPHAADTQMVMPFVAPS